MIAQIDWVSMTWKIGDMLHIDEEGRVMAREVRLSAQEQFMFTYLAALPDWKFSGGRKPFAKMFHSQSGGVSILTDDKHNFTLFEFSGDGCQRLRDEGSLDIILSNFQERITRLDIALDIKTDVRPRDFAEQRDLTRFKSHSFVTSDSGETYYVGSKKSDRYCRVYRYDGDHYRSEFLRCEFVQRDENAKKAVASVRAFGELETALSMINAYGFTHPVLKEAAKDAGTWKSAPRSQRDGATVRWLMKQVVPALERLYDEGNMEALTYFQERVTLIVNGQHKE